jgi:hypothetical protein
MKFPLRYLLVIVALAAGSLLLAACGGEEKEEAGSLTSTPVPASATAAADSEDFAEFADLVARAVAEQDTSFFAERVKGRTYTCTEADVGGEGWGIEQGLCQEVGQQVDVVEHWVWHSEGVLSRPDSMVTAIQDYFASALPGESDDYGTGAVWLYAIGTTRSSEPSRKFKAVILTAITPVDEGAASKPVRTARGVNFQYVEGRWVIIGMLWANVAAEELLSPETAPYDEWERR